MLSVESQSYKPCVSKPINDILDDQQDASKSVEDELPLEGSFVERYVKGEAHVIFEFRNGNGQEFAAVLEREVHGPRLAYDHVAEVGLSSCVGVGFSEGASHLISDCWGGSMSREAALGSQEQTVLVNVIEGMESPKRAVASLIWLERRYDLLCRIPQGFYLSSKLGRRVLRGILPNREANGPLSWPRTRFFKDCRVNQVIESAPEVLQNVAHDGRKGIGNLYNIGDAPRPSLSLEIILGNDFVWVASEKSTPSDLEISDVLFGPFKF